MASIRYISLTCAVILECACIIGLPSKRDIFDACILTICTFYMMLTVLDTECVLHKMLDTAYRSHMRASFFMMLFAMSFLVAMLISSFVYVVFNNTGHIELNMSMVVPYE